MIVRIVDYTFEVSEDTAIALRETFGGNPKAVEVQLRVASEGTQSGKEWAWIPHLRRIIINGVQKPEIPADFQKGGKRSSMSVGPTPEAAMHAICEKYLGVGGYPGFSSSLEPSP